MDQSLEIQRFVEELHWCIGQLELGLQRQSPDSRQAAESMKLLKILRSKKAPLVKKRLVMRNAFGDYRKKMKDAEKKSLSEMRRSRFQPVGSAKTSSGSRFFKMSYSKQNVAPSKGELNRNLNNLNLESVTSEPAISVIHPTPGTVSNVAGETTHQTPCSAEASTALSSETALSNHPVSSLLQNGQDCDQASSHGCGGHDPEKKQDSEFKYKLSDNSFVFSFEDPEDGRSEKDQEVLATGREISVLELPSLSSEKGSKKAASNGYKYQKSDNSFCFNFVAPDDC